MPKRIGFVSTRFAGHDGVSLESAKWAEVLEGMGHEVFWYAGRLDRDPERSHHVAEAFFSHPDNVWINERIFGTSRREPEVTRRIWELSEHLKQTLYDFIERFGIEVLVAQNALCIPLQIPLGVALTHLIAETGMPTIAHHHDFFWERTRFAISGIDDILAMSFPPPLASVQHVTINSEAQKQLSWRRGVSSTLIPNVLDFATAPKVPEEADSELRRSLELQPDDIVVLQPTRVVPRKGIQHAIRLVSRLGMPNCKLVVSHEAMDEGPEYQSDLAAIAEEEHVDLRFIHANSSPDPSSAEQDGRIFSLADIYSGADFITYPSIYEGFGNALIEAFYFRRPVLVNRYSIFVTDIEPKGFDVVTMDGYVTRRVVEQVRQVLEDPDHRKKMVERNYDLGRAFFSYEVLRRKLDGLMANATVT